MNSGNAALTLGIDSGKLTTEVGGPAECQAEGTILINTYQRCKHSALNLLILSKTLGKR